MILGRPANLVLGAVTAVINLTFLLLGQAGVVITPELVAAVNIVAGAIVALVANQPPTVNPGDTIHITTPTGLPNYETTVATPPAQSPPPVPVP